MVELAKQAYVCIKISTGLKCCHNPLVAVTAKHVLSTFNVTIYKKTGQHTALSKILRQLEIELSKFPSIRDETFQSAGYFNTFLRTKSIFFPANMGAALCPVFPYMITYKCNFNWLPYYQRVIVTHYILKG